MGKPKSMQTGQLNRLLHKLADLVNKVGALQNTDLLVSNSFLSPTGQNAHKKYSFLSFVMISFGIKFTLNDT